MPPCRWHRPEVSVSEASYSAHESIARERRGAGAVGRGGLEDRSDRPRTSRAPPGSRVSLPRAHGVSCAAPRSHHRSDPGATPGAEPWRRHPCKRRLAVSFLVPSFTRASRRRALGFLGILTSLMAAAGWLDAACADDPRAELQPDVQPRRRSLELRLDPDPRRRLHAVHEPRHRWLRDPVLEQRRQPDQGELQPRRQRRGRRQAPPSHRRR
mgnify:CR=1 FL=1